MLNTYPWWKNALIALVVAFGIFYASPNLYSPDPAIQISGESSGARIGEAELNQLTTAMDAESIEYFDASVADKGTSALLRLRDREQQLKAQKVAQRALGDGYIVALNLAPTTPDWLTDWGAQAMKLGLDLSGGVHFLLEVDIASAIETRQEFYNTGIKRLLRKERIRGLVQLQEDGTITGRFASEELRDQAFRLIRKEYDELQISREDSAGEFVLSAVISEQKRREIENYAVEQNLITLRNRVNELGVSEPLVQRQGKNRIVVQLPGIQDTAAAKRILGKTANLEFRLEARYDAPLSEREQFSFRPGEDGSPGPQAWLERDIVITGERVANAQAGFDQQTGQAQVNITLDSEGGTLMHRVTRHNINRRLGVLFIERKNRTSYTEAADGTEQVVRTPYDEKYIISLATIKDALGVQFRITGLENPAEAAELALLLRAGALAAPIDFVEERTVGPSLGAENIRQGVLAVQIGLALVALFMMAYYRVFGVVAVVALSANIMLLIAVMSMLGATLTLPGIAGIVLTVGMAVDANVLIFARIREELANRASPQQAIASGYDRAFVTIMDANITTLLVAIILYAVGTGPIKGFAVTLSIGIVTSMFTAIMGSRAIINVIYGKRRIKKLAI